MFGFLAEKKAEMLDTPEDILIRRTVGLYGDPNLKRRLYEVTGIYPGEPPRHNSIKGQLPVLVIPVLARYANKVAIPKPLTSRTAGILAVRLYGLTRDHIDFRDLDVQAVTPDESGIWYATRCPATGVTFYVERPNVSLTDAQDHIEGIYRQDAPNGYISGIRASVTTELRPLPLAFEDDQNPLA